MRTTAASVTPLPFFLCREIMETTTMRRSRFRTSRRAQETHCRPSMPPPTHPRISSSMPASTSRVTLSMSGTRFLARIVTAPRPVTTPPSAGLRGPSILQQQSRLSILQSQSRGSHEIDTVVGVYCAVQGENAMYIPSFTQKVEKSFSNICE